MMTFCRFISTAIRHASQVDDDSREIEETISIRLVVQFVDLVALELQTPEPRVVKENRRNTICAGIR